MSEKNQNIYDVCIVGAGPGGSTSAYYLTKQGKKVLLLEKDKFPRRKICGDAMFKPPKPTLRKWVCCKKSSMKRLELDVSWAIG